MNDEVSSTQEKVPPPVSDHPYQKFLAEQNTRDAQLDADRTAKRANVQLAEQADVAEKKTSEADTDHTAKRVKLHTDVVKKNGSEPDTNRMAKRSMLQTEQPDVTLLQRQLEAKTKECQCLNSELNKIEREMRVEEELSEVCTLVFNSLISLT